MATLTNIRPVSDKIARDLCILHMQDIARREGCEIAIQLICPRCGQPFYDQRRQFCCSAG